MKNTIPDKSEIKVADDSTLAKGSLYNNPSNMEDLKKHMDQLQTKSEANMKSLLNEAMNQREQGSVT